MVLRDGSGYSMGTDLISKSCQILGVCDEFDEMICGIGKARIRVHEAINCIRNYSGIWFDDEVVSTFLQLIAVYPVGSKVKTNEGELAVVMKQNVHFPERPVLRVINDKYRFLYTRFRLYRYGNGDRHKDPFGVDRHRHVGQEQGQHCIDLEKGAGHEGGGTGG